MGPEVAAGAAAAGAGGAAAAGGLTAAQMAALAISAVGTAASMQAARQQQQQQRNILNKQMERTEEATDKSAEMVQKEAQNYDQAGRVEQMGAAQAKSQRQIQADIQGAGGAGIDTVGDAGNVSDDFLRTKAARAIEEGTRMTQIAREQSRARAPGQMRLDDSLRMADLAGEMSSLWGGARNVASASGLDARSVQPGALGALGQVASAIAPAVGSAGQSTNMPGDTIGVPANPYATGPYRAGMQLRPGAAGINFGR